jgi:hypothetical protein
LKLADKLREKVHFGHSTTKAVLEKAGHKWVAMFRWILRNLSQYWS